MQQKIDLNLLKENPKLFFSQLPEKAEEEISEFLYFIIYKYNLSVELPNKNNIVGYNAKGLPVAESDYIEHLDLINEEINKGTAKLFTSKEVRKKIIDENNLV